MILRVLALPKADSYTGNPYPDLLYRGIADHDVQVENFTFAKALVRHYDVLHLHWPDSHLRSTNLLKTLAKHGRLALVLGLARARGSRVVWTLHNLEPHDRNSKFSQWLFSWWFVRSLTHLIALSANGRERALERYPVLGQKPIAVIHHGHYRPVFPQLATRLEARKQLGLPTDEFCFLFFGAIRSYKQVPRLIEQFRHLSLPKIRLLVAGKVFEPSLLQDVKTAAGDDPRVTLQLELIPEERVPMYFRAANVFVAPFADILNSGSVMLALSLDRPVLVPRAGALVELAESVGSAWVSLYDGAFTARHLEQAHENHHRRQEESRPDLSAFDWGPIATATVKHYTS